MTRSLAGLLALALFATSLTVHAAPRPEEVLNDPAMEQRAREISAGLRCLVCQNQSIDDSDAPLARDLRLLVRERLEAGDSDEDVIAFVVDRYGEYVLLSPRLGVHTMLLWGAPLAFLLIGGLAGAMVFRRRKAVAAAPEPLSKAEQARLDALLKED